MKCLHVLLILAALCFSGKALGQGECPGQHCSAKANIVNIMCKNLGQAGGVVFVEHNGSYCWCKCSCLASNTPVEIAPNKWKRIGDVKVGETVLARSLNGAWKQAPVVFSDGTTMPEKPYPYAIYVVLKDGTELVVTADHLFLINGNILKRADRLAPTDQLVGSDGKPKSIKTVVSGSYHGPIHHIAATKWDETNPSIDGHLINTNGVISGDYFAELHLSTPALVTEPQIGSVQYETAFKRQHAAFISTSGLPDKISVGKDAVFMPAKPLSIPEDAHPFIPKEFETPDPTKLGPLDHTIPYEMAQYLVNHYRTHYPDITYHIEWADNRVNAYAWMSGGKRHVALLGGLLRHVYVKQEGAGLVLAHEIGHHYGGDPKYPGSWASCEGQSDYWGALIGMRKVWWGHYAIEQTQAGADQLRNLFAFGLLGGNLFDLITLSPSSTATCSHPPAQCRYETYIAGMRADSKPSCAAFSGVRKQN